MMFFGHNLSILTLIFLELFLFLGCHSEYIHQANFQDDNIESTDELLKGKNLPDEEDDLFQNEDPLGDANNLRDFSGIISPKYDSKANLNEDLEMNDYSVDMPRSRRNMFSFGNRKSSTSKHNIDFKKASNPNDVEVLDNQDRVTGRRTFFKVGDNKSCDKRGSKSNYGPISGPRMKLGHSEGNISSDGIHLSDDSEGAHENVIGHWHVPVRKTSKPCSPDAGRPKLSLPPICSGDKRGKEYEDMLKGRIAEKIVSVLHTEVCKSPKLAQFFGNCQGSTPDKSDSKSECDVLLKPDTDKEIKSQLEAMNCSVTCHKLPPKLHEFLQWLLKAKPSVRSHSPKKQRRTCDQYYSDCTEGSSAFIVFSGYEVLPYDDNDYDRINRYRRNSYFSQESDDLDDYDLDMIAAWNALPAELIDSSSKLDGIDDTHSSCDRPASPQDNVIITDDSRKEKKKALQD